jgi:predicted N-acetyltransferase YhbS
MSLEIVRAKAEHVPEIARIIFEAFAGISQRHGFPSDIPTRDVGMFLAGMAVGRADFYGVTAMLDGKIVGSNFTQISDTVSGLGPITVDPACPARGVGRALMRHVVDWSLKNHGPMVRLMQDSFNMTSLSLYTAIGFNVVEPVVLMEAKGAERADDSVRALTAAHLPACEALCKRIYKVSRRNEVAFLIEHGAQSGFVPHGRFKGGKLAAYAIPGLLGHGVAESTDDLLVTIAQAVRSLPPPAHQVFIPTRNGPLLREALKRQMRSIKPMSLMALGPYEQPAAPDSGLVWTPSIAY